MPENKNFTYKKEFYNSQKSSNTIYPEREVSAPLKNTNMYTSETHNTNTVYPLNPPPGTNQTYYYKKEVNETKSNIYGPPGMTPPVNKITSLYEHNETNDTRNVFPPPTTNGIAPINLPSPQPGTNQTYMYKKETTNTKNTVYAPQPEPVTNKYYKFSEKTTTNTHSQPLLVPFPTQDIQPTQVDGPPKNLNQLLATFEEVYSMYFAVFCCIFCLLAKCGICFLFSPL